MLLPRFARATTVQLRSARSCAIRAYASKARTGGRAPVIVACRGLPRYSTVSSAKNMEEAMNNIEELFSAAKDEVRVINAPLFLNETNFFHVPHQMEYAQESVGSVYYHEDRVTAENAVKECLKAFDNFLKDLPSDEMRNEVQAKVGMKLKELKMEFEALPEEGD
ncbi:hypothetical protein VTP01DRAFT_9504 [Rhizomucor pusillus]|uniref:uncharacterized protein n=1 Tax=Rhizomucor pusillus TaxID=4840 RepID=UPI0037435A90